MLDFTASAEQLGKPGGGADLKLGLATAPALYAWEQFPQLGQLIQRKFSQPGDVDEVGPASLSTKMSVLIGLCPQARELILKSDGAERTALLAQAHSELASKALESLPDSPAKDALDNIARDTLIRKR